MKKRPARFFAGMLAALTLCVCTLPAGAALSQSSVPVVQSFSFARSGAAVEQARSYQIVETGRGRFARLELYYAYFVVLPVTDEEMASFSALLSECGVCGWNGFHETDPDALDGESFSLTAAFAGGGALAACGSNRFPANHAQTAAHIEAFFHTLLASYEIDVELL